VKLLVAGTVFFLSMFGISTMAMAGRANDVTYHYFSDASKTTEVGFIEYQCVSGSYDEGETGTPYFTVVQIPCNLWPSPQPSAQELQQYHSCTKTDTGYDTYYCII
jgi:hypothetical protein